jgi:hypothetical protein
MSFLDSLFRRKQGVVVIPPSDPRFQQAVVASRQDVIVAAEHKLGRVLTGAERLGIENITSLMMLESCCRAFSSTVSTQAEVQKDLEYFAKQVQKP